MPLKIPFRKRTNSTNKLNSITTDSLATSIPISSQPNNDKNNNVKDEDFEPHSANSHLSFGFTEDLQAVQAFLDSGGVSDEGHSNSNDRDQVVYGGQGSYFESLPNSSSNLPYSSSPSPQPSQPSSSTSHPSVLRPGGTPRKPSLSNLLSLDPTLTVSRGSSPSPGPPASPLSFHTVTSSSNGLTNGKHSRTPSGNLPNSNSNARQPSDIAQLTSLTLTSEPKSSEKPHDKGILSVFQRSRGRKSTQGTSPTDSSNKKRPSLNALVTDLERGRPGPKSAQTLADLTHVDGSTSTLEPPPSGRFGFFRSRASSSKDRIASANSSVISLGLEGKDKSQTPPPSSFQLKGFRAVSFNSQSPVSDAKHELPLVTAPPAQSTSPPPGESRRRSRTVGEGFVVVRSGKGSLDLDRLSVPKKKMAVTPTSSGFSQSGHQSQSQYGDEKNGHDYEVFPDGDRVSASRFMEAAKLRTPSAPFVSNGRESPALGLDLPPSDPEWTARQREVASSSSGHPALHPPRRSFLESREASSSTTLGSMSGSDSTGFVKVGEDMKIEGFKVEDVKKKLKNGKRGYQKMRKAFGSSDEESSDDDAKTVDSEDPYGEPDREEIDRKIRGVDNIPRPDSKETSLVEMAQDAKEWELGELLGWANFTKKSEDKSEAAAEKSEKKVAHRRMTSMEVSLQPPAPPFAQIRPTRSSADLRDSNEKARHVRTDSAGSATSTKPVGWGSEEGYRKGVKFPKRDNNASSGGSRSTTPFSESPAQMAKDLSRPQSRLSEMKGVKGKKEEDSSSDDDVPLAKLRTPATSSHGHFSSLAIPTTPKLSHKSSKSALLTPTAQLSPNRIHNYSQSLSPSSTLLPPPSPVTSSSSSGRVHSPSPIPPPSAFNRPKISSSLAPVQYSTRPTSEVLLRKTSGASLNTPPAVTSTSSATAGPSRGMSLPPGAAKADSMVANLKALSKPTSDSPASSTSGSASGSSRLGFPAPTTPLESSLSTVEEPKVALMRQPSRRNSMISLSKKISIKRRQNSYAGEMSAADVLAIGDADEKERDDVYKRMRERHRKEAKKAIELGNDLHGPGPKLESWEHNAGGDSDEEDDVPLGMRSYAGSTLGGNTPSFVNGMGPNLTVPTMNSFVNPQTAFAPASTGGLNINSLPPPPGVDPALYASLPPDQKLSLHQRGQMMMQMMAMAAQQMKAASEIGHGSNWDTRSNVSGMGGGNWDTMSAVGGMTGGGGGAGGFGMMGMGMPWGMGMMQPMGMGYPMQQSFPQAQNRWSSSQSAIGIPTGPPHSKPLRRQSRVGAASAIGAPSAARRSRIPHREI